MPKKTRQEKILAQLRRMQQEQQKTQEKKETVSAQPTISLNLESTPEPTPSRIIVEGTSTQDYSYVTADLKRTVIFAAVAVLFQIILSFFL